MKAVWQRTADHVGQSVRGKGRMRIVWRLLLVFAVAGAASLAPAGVALAKSGSVPVSPPSASTVVFSLSLAGRAYNYTWADVSGTGGLGAGVSQSYLKATADQDPQTWTGVWLRTVLADVEARSGITLDDNWKLKVTAVDGYVCSLFVGDVKDAANNYLLATDPVQGCNTEDPADATVWYEPTYVRICTNGDYGNTAFPSRLVKTSDSMTVLDASGNEIPAPTTAHDPIGVIVTGDDVRAPATMKTYSGNAYWLTKDDLAELKTTKGAVGAHAGLWTSAVYSWCENHGTPVYGFAVGSGIGIRPLLADAGLDDSEIAALSGVTVTSASDGFSVGIDMQQPRYVFSAPDATSGLAVDPLLALYVDEAPTSGGLPTEATTPVAGDYTWLLLGQRTAAESNKCSFVADASLVSLPSASAAFMVDAPDAYSADASARQKTNYTLADLVSGGNALRTYTVGGQAYSCDGADLQAMLDSAGGKICPQDKVFVNTSTGTAPVSLKVADIAPGTFLLAYYSEDAGGTKVPNATQTMLYGKGAAIGDVLSVTIQHVDPTAALALSSPTVSQLKASLPRAAKLALRAVATKAPGATAAAPMVWKSSSNKVVTVDQNGNVSGRATGAAVVTVTSGSHQVSFAVKVVAKAINATTVTLPRTKSVVAGGKVRMIARLYPAAATSTITWSSSNTKVAAIDRGGLLSAKKRGTTTITVKTSSGKKATCVVTVK